VSEDISKLPKWAQTKIASLERNADYLMRELDRFQKEQPPSPFYAERFVTKPGAGIEETRQNIDATRLCVSVDGAFLSIIIRDHKWNDGTEYQTIDLQWSSGHRMSLGNAAFVPTSYQSASIVPLKGLRS
jgi:hypothetical protein